MNTMEAQEARVYELAASIGEVLGREVTYENRTVEQYRALLQENGLPADLVA